MNESTSDAYRAAALQVACRAIHGLDGVEDARRAMRAAIDRIDAMIAGSLAWTGADTRLVVLPEYVLTGFPIDESTEEWQAKACLEVGGPEYEALGDLSRRHGIFLAGNAYELDAAFPRLFFQVSFVIAPSGDVVLRYRRLNSMFSPTPHDVWERYLDLYGLEGVFPVADTAIGRLGAVASEEVLFPEVARCMVLRGAEVLVHSSCEVSSPRATPKKIAKRARALENRAYLVSCNTGGLVGIDVPAGSTDGGSQIIDFEGRVLAEAGPGESVVACAELDLAALRRARRRPGMENLLSRQRLEAYAGVYSGASWYPPNSLVDGEGLADGEGGAEHARRTQLEVIERLSALGLL